MWWLLCRRKNSKRRENVTASWRKGCENRYIPYRKNPRSEAQLFYDILKSLAFEITWEWWRGVRKGKGPGETWTRLGKLIRLSRVPYVYIYIHGTQRRVSGAYKDARKRAPSSKARKLIQFALTTPAPLVWASYCLWETFCWKWKNRQKSFVDV